MPPSPACQPDKSAASCASCRVIMLSQAKRLDDVETGLRALSAGLPGRSRATSSSSRSSMRARGGSRRPSAARKVTELDPKNADKQLGYVQFLAGQRQRREGRSGPEDLHRAEPGRRQAAPRPGPAATKSPNARRKPARCYRASASARRRVPKGSRRATGSRPSTSAAASSKTGVP